MRFWYKAMAIAWKDAISEMRTKETISSVLVFTVLVIVIFNFAFAGSQEMVKLVAPGILWVTFTFAGVLGLSRSFITEKEQGCLEGLMVCPVSREVIFVGKALGIFVFMLITEAIALLIFTFLFSLVVPVPQIIAITVLTTVGFAVVGTLFSALAVNTKAREMVLPILFLPVVVPIVILAVQATGSVFASESWSGIATWLWTIAAFDAIFAVITFLVFTFVIEE